MLCSLARLSLQFLNAVAIVRWESSGHRLIASKRAALIPVWFAGLLPIRSFEQFLCNYDAPEHVETERQSLQSRKSPRVCHAHWNREPHDSELDIHGKVGFMRSGVRIFTRDFGAHSRPVLTGNNAQLPGFGELAPAEPAAKPVFDTPSIFEMPPYEGASSQFPNRLNTSLECAFGDRYDFTGGPLSLYLVFSIGEFRTISEGE